jgi:transcription elongation GreA/GreB family factor
MMRISKSRAHISSLDMKNLRSLVLRQSEANSVQNRSIAVLEELLDSAVESSTLPPTIVALGTQVLLKNMDSGERPVYTLVLPSEASISEGMISVLTPLGTALLGRSTGDILQFSAPGGSMKFRLEGILAQ